MRRPVQPEIGETGRQLFDIGPAAAVGENHAHAVSAKNANAIRHQESFPANFQGMPQAAVFFYGEVRFAFDPMIVTGDQLRGLFRILGQHL